MRNKFVRTTYVRNYLAAYDRLQRRGAEEASWMLVSAVPGLGKTKTVQWHAISQGSPYIRAKANWSVRWMLQEIADEFGQESTGSVKDLFSRILRCMAETQKPLTIDEARNTLHDSKLLETLRDLSDVTECPIVMSGEDSVLKRLTSRFPQIRSRISETVEFKPAAFEDIQLIFNEVCEVAVTDDVIAEVQRQSYGFFREIKNCVVAVERLADLQGVERIEAAHIAGKRLCQDRNDNRARATV